MIWIALGLYLCLGFCFGLVAMRHAPVSSQGLLLSCMAWPVIWGCVLWVGFVEFLNRKIRKGGT